MRSAPILKVTILFALTFTIAGLVYYLLGFDAGTIAILLLVGVFSILLVYLVMTSITLRHFRATEVDENTSPRVVRAVKRAAQQFGMQTPHVVVIPSNEPNAFAIGGGNNNYVAVTQGLLNTMDDDELYGVVSHELAHIRNFDTVSNTLGLTLSFTTSILSKVAAALVVVSIWILYIFFADRRTSSRGVVSLSLFLGYAIAVVAPFLVLVSRMTMSRRVEFRADATAAEVTGRPDCLARALTKIRDWNSSHGSQLEGSIYASLWINNPRGGFMSNILSSHPPADERIKRLWAMGSGVSGTGNQVKIGYLRGAQQPIPPQAAIFRNNTPSTNVPKVVGPPTIASSNNPFPTNAANGPPRKLPTVIIAVVLVVLLIGVVVAYGVLSSTSGTSSNPSKPTIAVATGSSAASSGDSLVISWTCSNATGVGNIVFLYYSPTDQWPTGRTLISSTVNDGSYYWLVPSTLNGSYEIIVTSIDGDIVGKSNTFSVSTNADGNPNPNPWVPDNTTNETRNEPIVSLSWQSPPPGQGSTPEQYYHWSFGDYQTLVLVNKVQSPADGAKIADILLFPNLRASQVAVTANVQSGPPLVVNIYDDGKGGSYGLIIDDTANIHGDKGWTWEYSSTQTSYSVSLNIYFYALGQQTFTLVAYDQDTGKKVNAVNLTTPAHIWGRGLAQGSSVGTWDGVVNNPDATGEVRNYTLNDVMSDLAVSHYKGSVKDVIHFEGVSVKVWGIIDGQAILWNPTTNGDYEFYWEDFNAATTHQFKIQVQFLTPIPTTYGSAIMHYGVWDNSSGEKLLGYFGGGIDDIWVYL